MPNGSEEVVGCHEGHSGASIVLMMMSLGGVHCDGCISNRVVRVSRVSRAILYDITNLTPFFGYDTLLTLDIPKHALHSGEARRQ
jgi:hypothetical protein